MIGVYIPAANASDTVESIKRAEAAGVPAYWLTLGGAAPDSIAVFAAASQVTQRIKMGTSIVPTYPRHPLALAQQAIAMASLAPGRFRLGIGPSHERSIAAYGIEYKAPLTNLREYLHVIRTLLQTGRIEFDGKQVGAHLEMPGAPLDVPVMASALRPASFRLCGELSDGAISWICPWDYLRDVALPAMREGAEAAGRPTPPLIAHVPVCLSEDREAVLQAGREAMARYSGSPNYQGMVSTAGVEGGFGNVEAVSDAVVLSGSEQRIVEGLGRIMDEGAGEVIAWPLPVGDRAASNAQALELVGRANRDLGFSG